MSSVSRETYNVLSVTYQVICGRVKFVKKYTSVQNTKFMYNSFLSMIEQYYYEFKIRTAWKKLIKFYTLRFVCMGPCNIIIFITQLHVILCVIMDTDLVCLFLLQWARHRYH